VRTNLKKFTLSEVGKEKVAYGTIAFIGYILSPLSWWNDIFVNIPIAYAVAWLVSLFTPELFLIAFTTAYVMTNVIGFILMHFGIEGCIKNTVKFNKKTMVRYILVSIVYTLIVVALIYIGFMTLS